MSEEQSSGQRGLETYCKFHILCDLHGRNMIYVPERTHLIYWSVFYIVLPLISHITHKVLIYRYDPVTALCINLSDHLHSVMGKGKQAVDLKVHYRTG